MMYQEQSRFHFHFALWEFNPHLLALPKRWAFPCHLLRIGCLQHPPQHVAWLADLANRLFRVCTQADLVKEASEDVKHPL